MNRNSKRLSTLRIAFAATLAAVMAGVMVACASMGRPEGGARDVTPPEFVRSDPSPGARNVSRQRIVASFDENVELDDAFNKVVVSPAQKQAAVVRSLGKRVTVDFRDTLLPNTTYTVDFGDAIKDLNEGNVLDGFALDFSTGDSIDTLRISGMVLEARTLEPAQGMTVGVFRNPTDTTFAKLPFERLARTNQYGQFTVRGLKPGRYAVYALNDLNRDNRWDRTEDVAFLNTLVVPSVEDIVVSDTLRDNNDKDSIVTRPGVAYLPDDILLTWFNEGYQAQYLKDYKRPQRNQVYIRMGASTDSLPTLRIVGSAYDGDDITKHSVLQRNETNDSLIYWLRTPEVFANDSLMLSVRHQRTDSLEQIVWKTDTLKFFWKEPKAPRKSKKEQEADTLPPPTPLISIAVANQTTHEIYDAIKLVAQTPFATIDTAGFHIEEQVDTLWKPSPLLGIRKAETDPLMTRLIEFERKPGTRYRLTIDTLAVTDIYGLSNKPLKHELLVRTPEEYSNLIFAVRNADTTAVVELLNASDVPVRIARVGHDGRAHFDYVTPGTYFARLFVDADGDGKWTTGSVRDSIQPEEVYYYPTKLDLRANWDVEQTWDIYEVALDRQKPNAIKKNKPKSKRGSVSDEDEPIEYDEWGDPIDPNDRYNRNNHKGGNSNPFGGFGGLQQSGGNTGVLRR